VQEPVTWLLLVGFTTSHAFCELIETALRELSNARFEARLRSKDRLAFYNELLQDDEGSIEDLAVLSGLSLIGAAATLARLHGVGAGSIGDAIIALALAAALLLLGQVLPRTFGDRFAESITLRLFPWTKRLLQLLLPVTRPFRWLAVIALRIAGSAEQEDAVEEADDEIRSAALEAVREGVLEQSDADMIENVMEFRAAEVSEIMTPRIDIIGIELETGLDEAVQFFEEHGFSRLPVYETSIDKIVGVMHIKDLLIHLYGRRTEPLESADQEQKPAELAGASPAEPVNVRSVMRKALFVPESKPVRDLLKEVRGDRTRMVVIVDEYGGTAGLVTTADIVAEIVGDLDDEHSAPGPKPIERMGDSRYRIDAKVHVDELNEQLKLSLPEDEDYETIGGYLATSLGRIPKVGDCYRFEELEFLVTAGDERRVHEVEMSIGPG